MASKLLSRVSKNVEMAKLREDEDVPVVKEDMTGKMFDKQDKLVEYIIANPTTNWHQLSIKAGYSIKGSENTVSRLKNDRKFMKKLQVRKDDLQQKLQISLDRVAEEYARMAFLDPSDYYKFDKEGNIVSKDSDVIDLKPVVTIGKGKYGKGVDLTFYNKMEALKALRDMFGYDKPSKHAHLLAGNGQGITNQSLESAIIGLITGTTQATTPEGLDKTPK